MKKITSGLKTLFIPNYANDKLKQILDKELESK